MARVQTMNVYSRLAHTAVEHFVLHGDYMPLAAHVAPELLRQRACYVTVLEMPGRRVRAMYGSVMPRQSTLAHEIVVNTVQALLSDPTRRLSRVELRNVRCRVSLLGPLMRVSDAHHLNPATAGVLVRTDTGKSGLLLPGRPGVETPDDQLATVLREAGIDTRSEAVTMYRFDVTTFEG